MGIAQTDIPTTKNSDLLCTQHEKRENTGGANNKLCYRVEISMIDIDQSCLGRK